MPPFSTPGISVPKPPAWKRLGLKLKSASDLESTVELSRKRSQSPTENEHLTKRHKTLATSPPSNSAFAPEDSTLTRKKSVSFTPETKIGDGDSTKQLFNGWIAQQKKLDPTFDFKNKNASIEQGQVKKALEASIGSSPQSTRAAAQMKEQGKVKHSGHQEKSKNKKEPQRKARGLQKTSSNTTRPFLLYLRQYHESRGTWKFNKNHQNHLIKHALDLSIIPSDHTNFLYEYIRGLQGGVRTRLRDAALAAKVEDQKLGTSGFPEEMNNKDQRQAEYELAIREYIATMTAIEWKDQEVGYEEAVLLGLSDKAMAKRAARRMRTEKILKELEATGTLLTDQRVESNVYQSVDDPSRKVARKRKQRTMVDDMSDSSSSESSSSSGDEVDDSDTASEDVSISSSSSSSESDSNSSSSSSPNSDNSVSSSEESDSD